MHDNSEINVCLMASGKNVWLELGKKLAEKPYNICMWIGDPRLDDAVTSVLPECKVYDFLSINKGSSLKHLNVDHALPFGFVSNPFFLTLKDQVLKMMDRQDVFFQYRRLEREAVFYSLCQYFYNELKKHKISLLISAEGPHSPAQMIIYGLCDLMNIPRYHFVACNVTACVFMRSSLRNNDMVAVSDTSRDVTAITFHVLDFIDTFKDGGKNIAEPLYIKIQRKIDSKKNISAHAEKNIIISLKQTIRNLLPSIKPPKYKANYTIQSYDLLGESLEKPYLADQKLLSDISDLKKLQKQRHDEVVSDNIEFSKEYVFFPLHYEPERTTNPDGGDFYNTYEALYALRSFVPLHIPIYIKEHYSQFSHAMTGHLGRSPYFYRALLSLPNVYLIDCNLPALDIVKGAQLTASITGTTCLEAAALEKKAMMFGYTWYSYCPNIFQYHSELSYDAVIKSETFTNSDVKSFFKDLIQKYAIRGCINPSNDKYYTEKYGLEVANEILDEQLMVGDIMNAFDTIYPSNKDASSA